MSDTMERTENEVEAQDEAQADSTEAKVRAKTTYLDPTTVEALDELPDNPKITRENTGRSKIYHNLLEKIAEQGVDNKWRPLAKFGTPGGAKTVANGLNRQIAGEIGDEKGQVKPDMVKDIPEYEGFRWVFDSRRVPNDEGKVESVLYAKLVEVEDQ